MIFPTEVNENSVQMRMIRVVYPDLHLTMLEAIVLEKNELPSNQKSVTGTQGHSEMTRPSGRVTLTVVFEGSQWWLAPRRLSCDLLLYILERVCSHPFRVRTRLIHLSLNIYILFRVLLEICAYFKHVH